MNVLEIKNLTKTYESKNALSDVSINIPKGCIFGLLGPNGAGKTTLLRILNQIISNDGGYILINGEPIEREHVRKLGYLPEERGLYKKMAVGKQIEYFAKLKGIPKKLAEAKCDYWLTKLGLHEYKKKRTMELSKGMQQKVQFIITVIHEPELIILDEPFSGFDPINAELIKREILLLKEKGTTILLSSHRMENVEEICDHIAMLNLSNKVLDGSIKEIKNKFKGDKYKLICTKEIASSKNYDIASVNMEEGLNTYELKLHADGNTVLKELIEYTDIKHFEEVIPSLEEIFFKVVEGGNHA